MFAAQALVAHLLPNLWPWHSKELAPYVRETRATDDVELIWANELDALLLATKTRHGSLAERAICLSGTSASVYFVTRPGLAECRQSRAILEALEV